MAVAPWAIALPWLCERNHWTTTAAELEQMKKYFEDNPRQLKKKKDSVGYLPLHYAAYYQRGKYCVELVRALLAAFPEGIQKKSRQGFLPLHLAAAWQREEHGVEVVKMLLTAYPVATKHRTEYEYLPLHLAAREQRGEHSLEVVKMLLTAYPMAVQHEDRNGNLPLHVAAEKQKEEHGVAVVDMLLAAYPMAVQRKDRNGNLPLHLAAEHQKEEHGVAVVKMLLTAYPMAVQCMTDEGYLPLHFAAKAETGEDGVAVLKILLTAYPMAVQHKNINGDLPLHLAAKKQRGKHGFEVVKMLLTAYPMATQRKTDEGHLPLHLAAQEQTGEHGVEIVKMLLTAYPMAVQHEDIYEDLPVDLARYHNSSEQGLLALLEKAAQDQRQPADAVAARKLVSAYHLLGAEADVVDTATPAHKLTIEQVEVLSRRARLLEEHGSSNSCDPLAAIAATASALAAEGRLPLTVATLQQAGPLLRELLVALQAPQQPALGLRDLEALSAAAEDAAARLRTCHGALMSHVSATPPPVTVDAALVDARDAALTAAQAASRTVAEAVLENDMDAMAARLTAAADELSALLDRVLRMTDIQIETDGHIEADTVADGASSVDGDSRHSSLPPSTIKGAAAAAAAVAEPETADQPCDWLETAMQELDTFSAEASNLLSRLSALPVVSLNSLGDSDTQPSRDTIEALRGLTHALLLPGLCHYLAYVAPWKTACTRLAARKSALRREADAASRVVATAQLLSEESDRWAAALEERHDKTTQLEATHGALRKARRVLLHAQADAADAQSGDESDTEKDCDRVRAARQRCRRACAARDTAANTMLVFALAYCPEVLVQQRKRLMPGGLPTVVSQRSRSDYDNVGPLERAGEGRHTLLSATFEGERCVLKVVPLSKDSALAREADILKQVKHPNIVELLSIFVENDFAYLHMAHASHGDLEHFLTLEAAAATNTRTRAPTAAILPPYQLQRMGRQLCEAVAYLAERSIVHCDIKPANVFVDGERSNDSLRVLLGDFDVSHTATGRTTTLTRAVSGVATHYTPGYAPPEVLFAAAGQPPRVSPAIDVYGLGCVLFAMHMHPRKLPEPSNVKQAVASKSALFSIEAVAGAATPAVSAWAASVPREVVQAATCADPRARSSARELLHTRYMLDASGSFAHVAIQRPAYWLHQTHTGSWLEEEPAEVRVAVERALNATADPSTHGVGRDSHGERFQGFKVTRVRRLEHPVVWSAYAAQRRHLADTLLSEGYAAPSSIEAVATDGCFTYPLEGGSLDTAAREVFLFHGSSRPASIANSGFDVRYAFAGAGAGAMFGSGLYFAESPSKADQYVGRDGTRPLTMVVARVLLGRTAQVSAPRRNWPFLPEVAEKSSVEVPVYYDSIVADMRPQGLRFREVVVGEGSRAYPELFVEYERV